MENDTETGGEDTSLSIEQAATAFAKLTTDKAVREDHAEPAEDEQGELDNAEAGDELEAADESEPADEEHTDEDEESEPEDGQGRFVADNAKVRLADGTVTTIHELKRGFLREADYTRKTQETSARLKDTETREAHIKASEQQINERFQYVDRLLQSMAPQPPDPTLAQTDPFTWTVKRAEYEQAMGAYKTHLDYIQGELSKASTTAKSKAEADQKAKVEREEAALYEKLPALRDPAKLTAFANDIKTFGQQTYGFTPEEIAQVAMDHRQALVMRDAIAWRKLQASKASVSKKVEGRPAIARGGKRQTPQEQRVRQASDAMSRLKETGSEADAVAAYLATRSR